MGHLHSIVELKTKVSPPGIEPDLRASRAHVRIRHTPATLFFVQHPAEESNLVRQIRSLPCRPSHSQGVICQSVSRPGLEPGPGPSEGPMLSATPPGHVSLSFQRPNLDSNQDQDLRTVLCCPLHHRDVSSIQSRRLDSHQHQPVYKTGAFLSRATSASQARAQGVEPCPPGLEAGCSPRSTLVW